MKDYKETKLNIKPWLLKMKVKTSNDKFLMWYVGPMLLCIGGAILIHVIAPNGFIH